MPLLGDAGCEAKSVHTRFIHHGLGDTIQFIRYAPLIKEIAREVMVWAQPALLPLLRTMCGIDRLLPLHDGTPDVEYDVDVESMELPHIFRTTLATIPAEIPYLHIAPEALSRHGRLAVGFVWAAGDWEHARRSIPFPLCAPLAAVSGVTLHILQRGPALDHYQHGVGILSGSDDVVEAARIIRALDLVISVDTMPVHRYDASPPGGCAWRAGMDFTGCSGRLALDGRV